VRRGRKATDAEGIEAWPSYRRNSLVLGFLFERGWCIKTFRKVSSVDLNYLKGGKDEKGI